MNFKEYFELFISLAGTALTYFFGELDGLLQALIALTVLDYLTGVLAAALNKNLSSAIGFKGIARKITIFAVIGLAHVVDRELLGGTVLWRDAVTFFYLANEGLSIVENAVEIGIPIPDIVKDKLLSFHEGKHEKLK